MNVIETLNVLGQKTQKRWKYINSGGCCVFASTVGAELKNMGIPVKGIVSSYHAAYAKSSIDTIRRRINRHANISIWADNGVYFSHIGIEFELDGKKYHYDTAGVRPAGKELDRMPLYKGRMTLKDLRYLAASDDGWNPCFDRKHMPDIERFVKKSFTRKKSVDKTPKWFYNLFFNEE